MPTNNKDSLLQSWKTKTGKNADVKTVSRVQDYHMSIWFLQTSWLLTTKEEPTSVNRSDQVQKVSRTLTCASLHAVHSGHPQPCSHALGWIHFSSASSHLPISLSQFLFHFTPWSLLLYLVILSCPISLCVTLWSLTKKPFKGMETRPHTIMHWEVETRTRRLNIMEQVQGEEAAAAITPGSEKKGDRGRLGRS